MEPGDLLDLDSSDVTLLQFDAPGTPNGVHAANGFAELGDSDSDGSGGDMYMLPLPSHLISTSMRNPAQRRIAMPPSASPIPTPLLNESGSDANLGMSPAVQSLEKRISQLITPKERKNPTVALLLEEVAALKQAVAYEAKRNKLLKDKQLDLAAVEMNEHRELFDFLQEECDQLKSSERSVAEAISSRLMEQDEKLPKAIVKRLPRTEAVCGGTDVNLQSTMLKLDFLCYRFEQSIEFLNHSVNTAMAEKTRVERDLAAANRAAPQVESTSTRDDEISNAEQDSTISRELETIREQLDTIQEQTLRIGVLEADKEELEIRNEELEDRCSELKGEAAVAWKENALLKSSKCAAEEELNRLRRELAKRDGEDNEPPSEDDALYERLMAMKDKAQELVTEDTKLTREVQSLSPKVASEADKAIQTLVEQHSAQAAKIDELAALSKALEEAARRGHSSLDGSDDGSFDRDGDKDPHEKDCTGESFHAVDIAPEIPDEDPTWEGDSGQGEDDAAGGAADGLSPSEPQSPLTPEALRARILQLVGNNVDDLWLALVDSLSLTLEDIQDRHDRIGMLLDLNEACVKQGEDLLAELLDECQRSRALQREIEWLRGDRTAANDGAENTSGDDLRDSLMRRTLKYTLPELVEEIGCVHGTEAVLLEEPFVEQYSAILAPLGPGDDPRHPPEGIPTQRQFDSVHIHLSDDDASDVASGQYPTTLTLGDSSEVALRHVDPQRLTFDTMLKQSGFENTLMELGAIERLEQEVGCSAPSEHLPSEWGSVLHGPSTVKLGVNPARHVLPTGLEGSTARTGDLPCDYDDGQPLADGRDASLIEKLYRERERLRTQLLKTQEQLEVLQAERRDTPEWLPASSTMETRAMPFEERNDDLQELGRENEELRHHLHSLQEELRAADEHCTALEQQLVDAEHEIADLREALERKQWSIDDLTKQVARLRVSGSEEVMAEKEELIKALREGKERLEEQLTVFLEKERAAEEEKAKKQEIVDVDYEHEVAVLREQLRAISSTVRSVQAASTCKRCRSDGSVGSGAGLSMSVAMLDRAYLEPSGSENLAPRTEILPCVQTALELFKDLVAREALLVQQWRLSRSGAVTLEELGDVDVDSLARQRGNSDSAMMGLRDLFEEVHREQKQLVAALRTALGEVKAILEGGFGDGEHVAAE